MQTSRQDAAAEAGRPKHLGVLRGQAELHSLPLAPVVCDILHSWMPVFEITTGHSPGPKFPFEGKLRRPRATASLWEQNHRPRYAPLPRRRRRALPTVVAATCRLGGSALPAQAPTSCPRGPSKASRLAPRPDGGELVTPRARRRRRTRQGSAGVPPTLPRGGGCRGSWRSRRPCRQTPSRPC